MRRQRRHRLAVELNVARGRRLEPGKHHQRRRLARPRGPQQRQELALRDVEVQILHDQLQAVVSLPHIAEAHERHGLGRHVQDRRRLFNRRRLRDRGRCGDRSLLRNRRPGSGRHHDHARRRRLWFRFGDWCRCGRDTNGFWFERAWRWGFWLWRRLDDFGLALAETERGRQQRTAPLNREPHARCIVFAVVLIVALRCRLCSIDSLARSRFRGLCLGGFRDRLDDDLRRGLFFRSRWVIARLQCRRNGRRPGRCLARRES